jgi:hypothetical protein
VEREIQALRKAGKASAYLITEALAWGRAAPADPDVAEALALAVEGWRWSACGDYNESDLPRRAFTMLHRQFPTSDWARRTKSTGTADQRGRAHGPAPTTLTGQGRTQGPLLPRTPRPIQSASRRCRLRHGKCTHGSLVCPPYSSSLSQVSGPTDTAPVLEGHGAVRMANPNATPSSGWKRAERRAAGAEGHRLPAQPDVRPARCWRSRWAPPWIFRTTTACSTTCSRS